MYGFEKFSEIMFLLCNKLFNMEVPKEINIKVVNNKKYVSALLNEIFEAGVHGKKRWQINLLHKLHLIFKIRIVILP